jgi:hypothetical protein
VPPSFAFPDLKETATTAGERNEDDGADETQTYSRRHDAKNEMDSVNDEERIARSDAFGSHHGALEDFMVKARLTLAFAVRPAGSRDAVGA